MTSPLVASWTYSSLIPSPPECLCDEELEQSKRGLLREVLVPLVAGRRWFFRRQAIERDQLGWLLPFSLGFYVELLPGDTLVQLRQTMLHELAGRRGHAVFEVRHWDASFGVEYGGTDAQIAMADFVTEAASVAVLERQDPIDVAVTHTGRGVASIEGIAHWWAHIREGAVIPDSEAMAQLQACICG